ncbi:MAG: hypothetical protein GY702_02485 [Desulfobulbaceae bacterium]|nr:hypothetical protein [Desulfobulbaceae bacterium]
MNLILTMAGKYTRFVNEGYRIPKYILPWGDKLILSEIVNEINKKRDFLNIYLIANKRDEIYMPHVRKILRALRIPVDNLFLISDTNGQAETAYRGIECIKSRFHEINGPIVFHNIDTILYKRDFSDLPKILEQYDGYIDIFKSSNHNYSYVLVKEDIVQSIAEKVVISDNATSGLYAFSDADSFLGLYSEEDAYISKLYEKMISRNMKIAVSALNSEKDTVVLGTPSEYLTSAYILDL